MEPLIETLIFGEAEELSGRRCCSRCRARRGGCCPGRAVFSEGDHDRFSGYRRSGCNNLIGMCPAGEGGESAQTGCHASVGLAVEKMDMTRGTVMLQRPSFMQQQYQEQTTSLPAQPLSRANLFELAWNATPAVSFGCGRVTLYIQNETHCFRSAQNRSSPLMPASIVCQ